MLGKIQNILTIVLVVLVLGLGVTVSCKEKKISELTNSVIKANDEISKAQTNIAFKQKTVEDLQLLVRNVSDAKKEDSSFYLKQVNSFQSLISKMNKENKSLKADVDSLLTGRYCKNIFGKIVKCRK